MSNKAQQVALCSRSAFLIRYILSTLLLAFLIYLLAYHDLAHESSRSTLPYGFIISILGYPALIICGKKRALICFLSLLSVYVLILLAYPILSIYWPELISHDLPYWMDLGYRLDGFMVAMPFLIVFSASFCFISWYLRTDSRQPLYSRFSKDKIEPGKALSLKEILNRPKAKQAPLRFDKVDKGLIARFYELYQNIRNKQAYLLDQGSKKLYLILVIIFCCLWFIALPAYFSTTERSLVRDRARVAAWVEDRVAGRKPLNNYHIAAALRRLIDHYNSKDMLEEKPLPEILSMLGLDHLEPLPSTADMSRTGRVIILQFHTHSYNRNNHLNGVYCYLDDDFRSESVEFIADYLPLPIAK